MLPNFLIIGAAKSGTSAVYAYLRQHPQVVCSGGRNPAFSLWKAGATFNGPGDRKIQSQRVTDLERIWGALPEEGAGKNAGWVRLLPVYLYSPEAPGRIHCHVPDVKLLVILRNPVERAYSGFRFLVGTGSSGYPPSNKSSKPRMHVSRQIGSTSGTTSVYLPSAAAAIFRSLPRERIAITFYEDFVAAPVVIIQRMFDFLGVAPDFTPDVSLRYNVSGTPRSRLLHAALARPNCVKDVVKGLLPAAMRRHLRAKLMAQNISPALLRSLPKPAGIL